MKSYTAIYFYVALCILSIMSSTIQGSLEWTPWSRPSPCSTTCGQGIISRIRECKPTENSNDNFKENCHGAATIEEACYLPPCNSMGGDGTSSACNCGCKLTNSRGNIQSRLVQKKYALCNWSIETIAGSSIVLTINEVKNFDWTKGGIYVTGKKRVHKFTEQYGGRMVQSFPIVIQSTSNILNLTLLYNKVLNPNKNVEMDASYTTYEDYSVINNAGSGKKNKKSSLNIPAIAGITACVLVIILASIIIVYRRISSRNEEEKCESDQPEEGMEDNCSSVSGSNRSTRQNKSMNSNAAPIKTFSIPGSINYSTGPLTVEERDRLLPPRQSAGLLQQRGYPDGNEMYVQAEPTMITAMPAAGYIAGQTYVNWPLQPGQVATPVQLQQLPQPAIDYMIQQAQLNFTRQMSFEQNKQQSSNPGSYHYPTSGGEG